MKSSSGNFSYYLLVVYVISIMRCGFVLRAAKDR